ncbi:MAG: hypothetical protein CNCCGFBP_02413 [Fimbriimonadaceae bacterium]|nr:hypothetical protein [Fimbriimonadaceae bacterium]
MASPVGQVEKEDPSGLEQPKALREDLLVALLFEVAEGVEPQESPVELALPRQVADVAQNVPDLEPPFRGVPAG